MTDLDFYAPDDFDQMDSFEDEFDEIADDFNWRNIDFGRLANTAATFGESAYGNYVSKDWAKKNRGKDAVVRGLLGALKGASKSFFGDGLDSDPFEPEFETDAIDEMEAMAEDAIYGDAMDGSLASDEMVSRSFGMMRAAPQMRPIMAALSREVRNLIMRSRRDPRMKAAARMAPLALRRTSVLLMRMATARRPISLHMAVRLFRAHLSRLMQSAQLRSRALHRSRLRARRYQSRHSGYPRSRRSRSRHQRPPHTSYRY